MHRSVKLASFGVACMLALSLTGCGAKITGVTMETPDKLERGTQTQVMAEYAYDKQPDEAKAEKLIAELGMTYASSDETVLTVDENGQITAVGAGSADVTMSSADGSITSTKHIEVVVTPTGLKMETELQMSMDKPEAQLTASVEPYDATGVEIVYASADESIVTVSENGKLTGIGAGETTVSAEIKGTELKQVCKVTVLPSVEEINLNATNVTLKKNETRQLEFTVYPENADISSKSWKSSDEKIVTVDESGKITAVADGEGEITLTIGNVSVGCKVKVSTTKPAAASNAPSGGTSSGAASVGSAGGSQSSGSAAPAESESGGHGHWTLYGDGDCFRAINSLRASLGLGELTWDSGLGDIAAARCRQIMDDFSHNGMTAPEICAMGTPDGASTVAAWQGSSAHYAQMVYPDYTRCAVAHAYDGDGCHYWVATFG